MNELEQKSITSLEVAEMMNINHWEVLRKLEGTSKVKGIVSVMTDNKIVVSEYFSESTYPDASGKENKCYLITKMGCDFLANKFTGEKGILFTAKYVKRFKDMEETIAAGIQNLSPNLQIAQQLLNQMIQQELSIKKANEQSQKAIDTTQAIKETIIGVYDDWRSEIKHLVSSIQRGMDKSYQETYNEPYDALEKRAHCDLSKRVNNGRFRLAEQGMAPSKINEFRRIDVIEADPKLKEIFTTIVKEYAIKFVA